ncbi:MAG: (d)CMP kinase [Betaproteobacteria bacterium]|nr:(d)CMP kinase [Betaproteobacteria bacterium]
MTVSVIAIDGPSASGKGTVAQRVAAAVGFNYLDSGALYRLVALQAMNMGVSLSDGNALGRLAETLDVHFDGNEIWLAEVSVKDCIRSEACSIAASRIAEFPVVREKLLGRQRAFRKRPGLVADGRDMASVVFPDAVLKVYLTATLEARAERRHKQLKAKGISATLSVLLQDLRERDARDANRSSSPLKQSPDARLLDTTGLTAVQAAQQVLDWYRESA